MMTQEERAAEDAAWASTKKAREKQDRLSALDAQMPRYVEDIIEAMDAGTRARLAQETLAKYQEKKTMRQKQITT